jgi:hypothetical protein
MGTLAAGVGNGPGKAARRATVFVGVTCGEELETPVGPEPSTGCELVETRPLLARPPTVVGS